MTSYEESTLSDEKLRFDGEVAIVVGGGGSLGGAYARLLGRRGAKVVVNDISNRAESVAAEIRASGGEAIAVIGNSAIESDILVERTLETYGRLDIAINSSGLAAGTLFHLMSMEEWNSVFDSHFTSTLMLARAAWPHLVASGNGRLINTGSNAMFGNPYSSTYCTAKAAIFGATRSWAKEGESQNVRVNVILPTAISDMTRHIPDPAIVKLLETVFQPERVAGLVGLIAHRDNDFNGMAFSVGGNLAAPVYLSEGFPVMVDDPESPESWLKEKAGLSRRDIDMVPDGMMEEFTSRLERMGLMDNANAERKKSNVWEKD